MNAVPGGGAARGRILRAPRTVTMLLVAKLVTQEGESLCRIRNAAPGGLLIDTSARLHRGQPVSIELRNAQCLTGMVAWCDGTRAGVIFPAPIDTAAILALAPGRGSRLLRVRQPRGPRIALDRQIEVEMAAGRVFGRVIDISQGGARLTLPVRPDLGEWLTLDLPGLKRKRAVVRWIATYVGVAFAEPLSFEALSEWLADGAALNP